MSDRKSWIVLLIILIIVVVGGFIFFSYQKDGQISMLASDESGYQAVFLVNNQVYFGKLSKAESQYPVLRDIYYLQVNQTIQPVQGQAAPAPNSDVNLIKLGGELHGPVDEMRINRDHILLVEDLREDSNVVSAIMAYKQRQSQPAQ